MYKFRITPPALALATLFSAALPGAGHAAFVHKIQVPGLRAAAQAPATPPPPAGCTSPWGASLVDGQTTIAYATSSAFSGVSVCSSEVRTCANGALSGSNQHQACTEAYPTSCNALHQAAPSLPSGTYALSPDGSSANSVSAYCDMSTDGGGWTLVWQHREANLNSTTLPWDAAGFVVQGASNAIIAYADASQAHQTVSNGYSFAMPGSWKTTSPMASVSTDVTVTVKNVTTASTASRTLRFGTGDFIASCTDGWSTNLSYKYGRICIAGEADAPQITGFAKSIGDTCNLSTMRYNTAPNGCSTSHAFSIFVR